MSGCDCHEWHSQGKCSRCKQVVNALAARVLRQLDFQEGWCSFCRKKVGNELACNDKHHAPHCVIHDIRKATKE